MAASSPQIQDLEYLYASNANVSNFVSEKLHGDHNYHFWKKQILCLMETHDMRGLVDAANFDSPRVSSMKMMKRYDTLLKGWIFSSVSKDVLDTIVNLSSAKDVWKKVESLYDPTMTFKQGKEAIILIEEDKKETSDQRNKKYKMLRKATMEGKWWYVKYILLEGSEDAIKDPINSDMDTIVHLAVGIAPDVFVKSLLEYIRKEKVNEVLKIKNKYGSTALHVAAIVGNKYAARLMVEINKDLVKEEDEEGQQPISKAYFYKHFDTFLYLLEGHNDVEEQKYYISLGHGVKIGVGFLVNAISTKKYETAIKTLKDYPKFAVKNDEVLTAVARTFPSGLNYWEALFYPSLDDIRGRIIEIATSFLRSFKVFGNSFAVSRPITSMLSCAGLMLFMVHELIIFLTLMVHFPFSMVYFLWWEIATRLGVPPIKHIAKKKNEWYNAKMVLELVCEKIEESGINHTDYYKRPILEAACRNAYPVVDEILRRSPNAIQSTDESGYDIIQLAIIHRSEKIYNLIYEFGERKSHCRVFKDSSKNNILHLVGKLAPSYELNRGTGAALQLQREIQWRKELKKVVLPSYITEKNISNETPRMTFTREHEKLVKEGETWMKTTAESCSITAALITTIVFAAAITVPGGNNQEKGIPLFTQDIAFIIFAISDAVSLFTSTTSLLVFLSILTARFSEHDFLVRLPRRLIIGLCTLFVSTAAMMVAFSATLFLVFCRQKPWMLGPICGSACLPIAVFFIVQFPLIVDLYRSTYVPIFGKKSYSQQAGCNLYDV